MKKIPNYTIERELGRGGMATVYLAVQDMLHRYVALKVMLPELIRDENFRKSFLSEGSTIASLQHSNIVSIHDIGILMILFFSLGSSPQAIQYFFPVFSPATMVVCLF